MIQGPRRRPWRVHLFTLPDTPLTVTRGPAARRATNHHSHPRDRRLRYNAMRAANLLATHLRCLPLRRRKRRPRPVRERTRPRTKKMDGQRPMKQMGLLRPSPPRPPRADAGSASSRGWRRSAGRGTRCALGKSVASGITSTAHGDVRPSMLSAWTRPGKTMQPAGIVCTRQSTSAAIF